MSYFRPAVSRTAKYLRANCFLAAKVRRRSGHRAPPRGSSRTFSSAPYRGAADCTGKVYRMETLDRNYVNIEDEMRRSYLDYAMSVIIGSALQNVRDDIK